MGYLSGLLGGFTARKREVEQDQIRSQELALTREAKVYEALINSPDPEIQAHALTGLLTSAQAPQRKGGLRGWLGEMQANPTYEQIKGLMGTPVESQEPTYGLPSRAFTGYIPQRPAAERPLAQPETAATEPGAPPLTSITPSPAVGQPPAAAAQIGQWEQRAAPVTGTRTVTRPRQILRTPGQANFEETIASGRAKTAAELERATAIGFSPEEYKALEQMKYRRYAGMSGYQSIPGELPDGTPAFGTFDRLSGKYLDPDTNQPLEGFRPRTTTGSTSLGSDRESISRELFGKRASQLTATEMAQVNNRLLSFGGEKAGAVESGRGSAAGNIPLSTSQRFQATTDLSKQWTTERAAGREMERQFQLMQAGLTRVDADPIGGSQAVLVTFQKILDPSSVVRESEYARSPQGLAIMDWIQGQLDRYGKGGAGVPKPILAEMVKTAQQFMEGVKGSSDAVRQRITDTATSYEIDPRLVLGADYRPSAAVGAPPPGARPAGGAGLDATAPSVFVDKSGNLVYH